MGRIPSSMYAGLDFRAAECVTCGAAVGERCVTDNNNPGPPHARRVRFAMWRAERESSRDGVKAQSVR